MTSLCEIKEYHHWPRSILSKTSLNTIFQIEKFDLIIHCAAQPSHDMSAGIPYEDFQTNALGTINLLEIARQWCPETPFIFVSTNKVYGDRPNQIKLREAISRFHYDEEAYKAGIDESMSIDQCLHSPFGASKAAADLMVQEYGRYFNMPTVCFRCGCITGLAQQGVELHGFLNYLCKTVKEDRPYTIYGHKGKQVRDVIHAADLVAAFHAFALNPKKGEVYNMGGGHENTCSLLEALDLAEEYSGKKPKILHSDARKGDHICYYTDYRKFQKDYTNWRITKSVPEMIQEMLL
jgi:CDP-paratose 2-epimerase